MDTKKMKALLERLGKQTLQAFRPPVSMPEAKALLNPVAGKYGLGATAEDLGAPVVAATDDMKARLEDANITGEPYTDAAFKLLGGVALDQSSGLTPAGAQANLGALALSATPVVVSPATASRALPTLTKAIGKSAGRYPLKGKTRVPIGDADSLFQFYLRQRDKLK